jgi:outer membrane lipoprotein SlyB
MITRFIPVIGAMSMAMLLAACAAPEGTGGFGSVAQAAPVRVEHGYVEAIQVYRKGDNQPVNVGTLLGGLAGGVIGHQIGGGSGNTVATIGGAIAGAVVGNEVEKNRVEGTRYRITVHLNSGATLSVEEADEVNLRIGDRVRVENNRVFRE